MGLRRSAFRLVLHSPIIVLACRFGFEVPYSHDGDATESSADITIEDAPDDEGIIVPETGDDASILDSGGMRPPLPCPPGSLACTDFDGTGSQAWTNGSGGFGGATGFETTTMSHSGRRSFYATASDRGYATMTTRLPAPLTSGGLYARIFLYVRSGSPVSSAVALARFAEDSVNDAQAIRWGLAANDAPQLSLTTDGSTTRGPGTFARGAWTCIELALASIDDTNGHATVLMNDVLAIDVGPGADTLPPTGIQRVSVGAMSESGNGPIEVFIDDVAVSTSPIGCN